MRQIVRRSLQTMIFAEQPATESRVVVGLAAQDRAAMWQPVAYDAGPSPPPPPSLAILAQQLDEAEQHEPITKTKRRPIALSRGPRVAGWVAQKSAHPARVDPETTAEIIARSLKAEL